MKRLLIVVDMLNDFLHPKGVLYCGEEARNIIEPTAKLIRWFRSNGFPVIYIQDAHDPEDKEFERFPPHAIKGTWGSAVIDELKPEPGDPVIPKTRFSAFFNTNLDEVLRAYDPAEVWVVGVCTSICVMDTVADLRNRDYVVVVPTMCVADFDPEMHSFALKRMEKTYGVKILVELSL
ncbi:MAG: cysteine hydrolase [Syntrophobacterales bacterium]|nr:cysteine hydrolase [Syntrophobacterales bacterium]